MCHHCPVDESLQVTEVSDAETALTAQSKDWHCRTCYSFGIAPRIAEFKCFLLGRWNAVRHGTLFATYAVAVTIYSISV